MDPQIETLIKDCPKALRGRTGELTRQEREQFDRLGWEGLHNKVSNASPGFASHMNWIDPTTGVVAYEDDQRRSISLEQLGYRLIDLEGQRTWLPNRPEVIRAHRWNIIYFGHPNS